MIPFNVLTPTRYGTFCVNQLDQWVAASLLRYGEFSELEVQFLRPYLLPGSVVLDIGANIGALTIPFAQAVGPSGCVIAFEPQRICYQTLCANVMLQSLTNVIALQYAVGFEGDSIRVPHVDPTQKTNFGGVSLSADANGDTVSLVSLDEMGFPKPALIKIDVESMEADVLRGARAYITEHKPVLYVEADRPEKLADLMSVIDSLEYNAFRHEPLLYNPENWRGDKQNIWPNVGSKNWLCLPRGQTPPEGLERET